MKSYGKYFGSTKAHPAGNAFDYLELESRNQSTTGINLNGQSRSPGPKTRIKQIFSESFSRSHHDQDSHQNGKSWRAPIIMITTFLLGLALSILHDGMNRGLNRTTVPPDGPWSQQWTSRWTTALAFLVQTAFVACVGTAYVQRQWFNLWTSQQAVRVRDMDTLSSGLKNPFVLVTSFVWLKNPLLLAVVTLSWTMPFAAVLTPGTLTVQPQPLKYNVDYPVPQLSNAYSDYASEIGIDGEGSLNVSTNFVDIEANAQLSRLAFAAGATAKIISSKPGFANQTYNSTFFGPALKCVNANRTMMIEASNFSNSEFMYYAAWTDETPPWKRPAVDGSYDAGNHLTDYTPLDNGIVPLNQSRPNILWIASALGDAVPPNYYFNVTECHLWNASYDVEIHHQNFEQSINIRAQNYINQVNTTSYEVRSGQSINPPASMNSTLCYRAVMYALGSLLVGTAPSSVVSNYDLLGIDFTRSERMNQGLQELSHNVTLSLLSQPSFLANNTKTTTMVVEIWPNTYIYQPRDLLIVYGLLCLFSLLCCIVGLHAFWVNGSSFQNTFSTYVRAAQSGNIDFSTLPAEKDRGADPLPKDFGNVAVKLRTSPRSMEDYDAMIRH